MARKVGVCKPEEKDYELIFTDADTIVENYSLEQILRDVNDESIIDDIPTQRDADLWSKKDKTLLVHTVLINLSILPISMVKCGTGRGVVKKLIDGKQRVSTLNQFKNNEFALSSICPSVKMRRVVMVEKRDEDGNVVMEVPQGKRKAVPVMTPQLDENGNCVTEEFFYKIAGKYYNELPDSLQKQFDTYKNMPQHIHINYTPEEMQLQMLRDNTSVKMNPAQVGIVVCGDELAEWLHSFREHDLFLNCSNWKSSEESKSLIERCITEAFILTALEENQWNDKYSVNVETFKTNANEQILDSFKDLVDDFTNVIKPYPELKQYLTKGNLHIILAAYCHFCDLTPRYNKRNFAEFLCKWFESIKDTTEYDGDKTGTKQKTKVLGKLNILDRECLKYMQEHGCENEFESNENADNIENSREFIDEKNVSELMDSSIIKRINNKSVVNAYDFAIKALMVAVNIPDYHFDGFDEDKIVKFCKKFNSLEVDKQVDAIDECKYHMDCLDEYMMEIPLDSEFITEENLLCLLNVVKTAYEEDIEEEATIAWLVDFEKAYTSDCRFATMPTDIPEYVVMGKISYMNSELTKFYNEWRRS